MLFPIKSTITESIGQVLTANRFVIFCICNQVSFKFSLHDFHEITHNKALSEKQAKVSSRFAFDFQFNSMLKKKEHIVFIKFSLAVY